MKNVVILISTAAHGYAEVQKTIIRTAGQCISPVFEILFELSDGLEKDSRFNDAMNSIRSPSSVIEEFMPNGFNMIKAGSSVKILKKLFSMKRVKKSSNGSKKDTSFEEESVEN